jgi:hypothetical protein
VSTPSGGGEQLVDAVEVEDLDEGAQLGSGERALSSFGGPDGVSRPGLAEVFAEVFTEFGLEEPTDVHPTRRDQRTCNRDRSTKINQANQAAKRPARPTSVICQDCGDPFDPGCKGRIPLRCSDCRDSHKRAFDTAYQKENRAAHNEANCRYRERHKGHPTSFASSVQTAGSDTRRCTPQVATRNAARIAAIKIVSLASARTRDVDAKIQRISSSTGERTAYG